MDLSYEDRWINLRRQIEDDIATLEIANHDDDSATSRAIRLVKIDGLRIALAHMDAADRVGAHRA